MLSMNVLKLFESLIILINSKNSSYYNPLLYKKLWMTVTDVKTDKVLGTKIFNFIANKKMNYFGQDEADYFDDKDFTDFINNVTVGVDNVLLLSSSVKNALKEAEECEFVEIEDMNEDIRVDISIFNDENFYNSALSEHRAECREKIQELFKIIKEENKLSDGEMRFIFGDNLDKDIVSVEFVTEYAPLLERYLEVK